MYRVTIESQGKTWTEMIIANSELEAEKHFRKVHPFWNVVSVEFVCD